MEERYEDAETWKVRKEKSVSAAAVRARAAAGELGESAGRSAVRGAVSFAGDVGPEGSEFRAFLGAGRLGADTLGVIGARSAAKYADASVSAAGVAAELMAEGLKRKAAHPKGHAAGKEGSAKPAGTGNAKSAGSGANSAGKKSAAGGYAARHVSAKDVAAGSGFPLENLTRTQVKVLRTHAQEAAAMVNFRTDLLEMAGRNPKAFHRKETEYLADEASFYHMKNPGMTKRMAMQLLAKSEDPRIQKLLIKGLNVRDIDRLLARKDLAPLMRNALVITRLVIRKEGAAKIRRAREGRLVLHTVNLMFTGGGLDENASAGAAQLSGAWRFARTGAKLFAASGHLAVTSAKAAGKMAAFAAEKSGVSKALGTAAVKTAAAAGAAVSAAQKTRPGKAVTSAAQAAADVVLTGKETVSAAAKEAASLVKDGAEHAKAVVGENALYRRVSKQVSKRKTKSRAAKKRREQRREMKKAEKASGFRGRRHRKDGGISGLFGNIRKILYITIAVVIALWILLLIIIGLLAGSMGEMQITTVSTMDMDGADLSDYLQLLYEKDQAREVFAIEAAGEKLLETNVRTVTGGRTIDEWGHPANEDPEGNAQEAFDGINLIYVDGSAFDEGSTDETGRPTDDHVISSGYSSAEAVIAAAAAMFSNTGIEENGEAFLDLVEDLYDIMNPSDYLEYCFETDIYADAYWTEEEWTEEVIFTYYCDDAASRAAAEEVISEFRASLSALQEEGAGVYGYQYTETVTDRDGNAAVSKSGVTVLPFTEEVNDHEQLITTHDVSSIAVPLSSTSEGCCSYTVTTYELIVEEVEDTTSTSDTDDSSSSGTKLEVHYEPVTTVVYYCPGHVVSVSATVDYGRRDVDVYIPVWTIDDLFERFTVEEYLPDWESASYAEMIRAFVEDGGFQIGDTEEYYRTLCENFLSRDWEEAYGVDVRTGDVVAGTYSSGERTFSDEEIDAYISSYASGSSSDSSSTLSGSREALVRAAYEAVGTICYYYGGKPVSPVYEENGFGETVSPDPSGRTIRGLDCSGFIDYIAWQVTGSNNYMQGLGTAGAPGVEFYDASELQPGDLGMYKSRSDSAQGASNHVGIFVGWDEDGTALWIACGNKGVTLQRNSGFVVYYRCPLE